MRTTLRLGLFFFACTDAVLAQSGDIVRYVRNVTVEPGKVAGDVVCIGCSVRVDGKAEGDSVAVGGDIEVNGSVNGDAIAVGGRVRVRRGAVVGGDVVAVGGTLVAEEGAVLGGDKDSYPWFHWPGQRSFHPLGILTIVGGNTLLILLAGLLFGTRRAEAVSSVILRRPIPIAVWSPLISGAFLCILFMNFGKSIVARSLYWLAAGAFGFALLLGYLGMAWLFGQKAAGRRGRLATWLAGAAVWNVAFLVPVAGFALLLLIFVFAPGVAVVGGWGSGPGWLSRLTRRS